MLPNAPTKLLSNALGVGKATACWQPSYSFRGPACCGIAAFPEKWGRLVRRAAAAFLSLVCCQPWLAHLHRSPTVGRCVLGGGGGDCIWRPSLDSVHLAHRQAAAGPQKGPLARTFQGILTIKFSDFMLGWEVLRKWCTINVHVNCETILFLKRPEKLFVKWVRKTLPDILLLFN